MICYFTERYFTITDLIVFSLLFNIAFCRKYNIKFEGHILDPILNAATKIITTIFKKYVLAHIEDRALYIFRAKIDEWNKTYAKNVTVEEIEQIRDIDTLDFNTLDIDTFDIKLKTLDLFSVDL